MRKRIALLLTTTLFLSLCFYSLAETASLTDEERISKLSGIVQSYNDNNGYHLSYDSENKWYSGNFSLKSTLGSCEVTVYVFEDMVTVTAQPSLVVPKENIASMALFQTMVNNWLFYSHFNMDVEKGKIETRSSQIIENVFPTEDEIDTIFSEAILTLDEYGDYLNLVALGSDPYEIYASIVNAK